MGRVKFFCIIIIAMEAAFLIEWKEMSESTSWRHLCQCGMQMEGSSWRFYISQMELVAEMQLEYLKSAERGKVQKEKCGAKRSFSLLFC